MPVDFSLSWKEKKVEPISDQPTQIYSLDDYLVIPNISCVDADGNIFEQHPVLYVKKDVERNGASHVNFTSYAAASHFESQGLYLPSFALSCNIVAALYQHRNDLEANKLLLQYKNHGAGNGCQAQNTIINYSTQEIIHYPSAADFSQATIVNAGRQRKTGNFAKALLQDRLLEDAIQDADHSRFVKQLTGLRDPSVLVEIGKYFGKSARPWFPWSGQTGASYAQTRAAWFGCYSDSLSLVGYDYLNYDGAARGVRRGAP